MSTTDDDVKDTGDLVQPDALDVTPEPVTDPSSPDWVEPFLGATPVPRGRGGRSL